MSDIFTAFKTLIPSHQDGTSKASYFALKVAESTRNYIAKSECGNPVLLIETSLPIGAYPAPLKLEYLTVVHGYTGTMNTPVGEVTGVFSIVECHVTDEPLIGAFIRLSTHLLNNFSSTPGPMAVAIEIRKLVQIFQALRQPPVKSIQGLWAELFVLSKSPELTKWASAWHVDPMERYDFAMQRLRVEVKSSSNRIRRHQFSHEQLHPPTDVELWIASVFVERSTAGTNCIELLHQIQSRLSGDSAFQIEAKVMTTLGADYLKASAFSFDEDLAKDSLSFIPLASIPRITDDLPEGISELRYSVLIPQSASSESRHPSH